MLIKNRIARLVALRLEKTADRYDQIWAIKQALFIADLEIFTTDRPMIDDILDVLFDEYGFQA